MKKVLTIISIRFIALARPGIPIPGRQIKRGISPFGGAEAQV